MTRRQKSFDRRQSVGALAAVFGMLTVLSVAACGSSGTPSGAAAQGAPMN